MKTLRQAAVFDMDGTLVDSERLAMEVFPEAARMVGVEVDRNLFFQMVGLRADLSQQILVEALGRDDALALVAASRTLYENRLSEGCLELKPGALELVLRLRERGIPLAVATSTQRARALRKLRATDLLRNFDTVVGGDEIARGKPAPDIYLEAARRLEVKPSACIAFEDSPTGLKAASAAGLFSVLIPDLIEPLEDVRALADIVLTSLEEVEDGMLDEWLGDPFAWEAV